MPPRESSHPPLPPSNNEFYLFFQLAEGWLFSNRIFAFGGARLANNGQNRIWHICKEKIKKLYMFCFVLAVFGHFCIFDILLHGSRLKPQFAGGGSDSCLFQTSSLLR